MKLERLLARRYIIAQKRHSLLTVCSIAIAVALMSMMFCLYTTYHQVKRNQAYDDIPGHFVIYNITEEQENSLRGMPEISEIRRENGENGWTISYITVDRYIEEASDFINKMKQKASLVTDTDSETPVQYNINYDLLELDLLTDMARYKLAIEFALFFVLAIVLAFLLRLVIDTAFEISSKERERQFGVLQSIGATPKQIVRIVTAEGLYLSAVGVPLGGLLGILLGFITFRIVLSTGVADLLFDSPEKVSRYVRYSVKPSMLLIGVVIGFVWVMFSAYGTGMRVIKKTPVEAITSRANTVKKIRRFSLSGLLFGWTGKLAHRNARRQKKRFVITILSLTVSLLFFAAFGTVMDKAEVVIRGSRYELDAFGYIQTDFNLTLMTDEQKLESGEKAIKEMEDSGLFSDFEYYKLRFGSIKDDNGTGQGLGVNVFYINSGLYDRIFRYIDKPMSYSEFQKYGKALTFNAPKSFLQEKQDTVKCTISEAYYNYEGENIISENDNPENENATVKSNGVIIIKKEAEYSIGMNIVSVNTSSYTNSADLILLLPISQYEADGEKYGFSDLGYMDFNEIRCNLKKGADYHKALEYFNTNMNNLSVMIDSYGLMQNASTVIAAVRTLALVLNLMIALIAVVNMINIISTGILNRKSELASMQCTGMTRGQMYRLVTIECLQFVLYSAIIASIFACLLVYGTDRFIEFLFGQEENLLTGDPAGNVFRQINEGASSIVSYGIPLAKIWLAAIPAFIAAMIASVLPLRRMQKESLIDQIRSVE